MGVGGSSQVWVPLTRRTHCRSNLPSELKLPKRETSDRAAAAAAQPTTPSGGPSPFKVEAMPSADAIDEELRELLNARGEKDHVKKQVSGV